MYFVIGLKAMGDQKKKKQVAQIRKGHVETCQSKSVIYLLKGFQQ